ncbi:MAG: hypothetical protein ABW046_22515 [Actinoplanes sp.]
MTNALKTHAQVSGLFEYVAGHAILAGHGSGVAWWCMVDTMGVYPAGSGLNAATGVLVYKVMVTLNTSTYEPLDDVDPRVTQAADVLFRAYIGGFTLGGIVRNVDVFGAAGQRLVANAGWVTIGGDGGGRYRAMIITLPLIINDLWTEVA